MARPLTRGGGCSAVRRSWVMRELTPFLMFCGEQHGKANEAIRWYCSIFEDSEVVEIDRHGVDEGDAEGTVRYAVFRIGGHKLRAIDGGTAHAFTFTPAFSLWIECSSDEEIERVAKTLGEGGVFLMPLDAYDFSPKFCWVQDRYGVSWQLSLPIAASTLGA